MSWIAQGFTNVVNSITSVLDYLNPTSKNFILSKVIDFLNPVSENFILKSVGNFLSDIFNKIGDILSYINPLSDNFFGKKLIELFGELLQKLFIPKEESFTKFENVFKEKLSFIDSIKTGINSIKNMLNNIESCPKFTIDIDSKYYKGELTVIDLAWYSQYKTYGDLVITGFTYIFFFLRIFIHIPNILHGVSSVGDITTDVKQSDSPWYIKGQKSLFK